jgi:hypothetical protein
MVGPNKITIISSNRKRAYFLGGGVLMTKMETQRSDSSNIICIWSDNKATTWRALHLNKVVACVSVIKKVQCHKLVMGTYVQGNKRSMLNKNTDAKFTRRWNRINVTDRTNFAVGNAGWLVSRFILIHITNNIYGSETGIFKMECQKTEVAQPITVSVRSKA